MRSLNRDSPSTVNRTTIVINVCDVGTLFSFLLQLPPLPCAVRGCRRRRRCGFVRCVCGVCGWVGGNRETTKEIRSTGTSRMREKALTGWRSEGKTNEPLSKYAVFFSLVKHFTLLFTFFFGGSYYHAESKGNWTLKCVTHEETSWQGKQEGGVACVRGAKFFPKSPCVPAVLPSCFFLPSSQRRQGGRMIYCLPAAVTAASAAAAETEEDTYMPHALTLTQHTRVQHTRPSHKRGQERAREGGETSRKKKPYLRGLGFGV